MYLDDYLGTSERKMCGNFIKGKGNKTSGVTLFRVDMN